MAGLGKVPGTVPKLPWPDHTKNHELYCVLCGRGRDTTERRVPSRSASFPGRLPSIAESIGGHLRNLAPREQRKSAPEVPPRLYVPGSTVVYLDDLPVLSYQICGVNYSMQQPQNEGVANYARQTISGRNLTYRLKVVQQPEKARACGSGPRSSADRRPVDPPPVVKLTIFEGSEDITLRYDAGFMLYASLDVARPIAQGRMHSAQVVPVLTGVAVAGVAYLDRPKQAGYFIFPDLSVRHEGWYRLRFHLFEQVKRSDDADTDRPFEPVPASTQDNPQEPVAYEAMANRMYVYSAPFQVFSAKKFPGLNTSTELSKVVADQGCRVRIRREIRQRRKPKAKDDGDEEQRKSIHGTPEPAMHHRSLSRDLADPAKRLSIELPQPHVLSRHPSMEHITVTTPLIGAPLTRAQSIVSSPMSSSYLQTDSRPMYRPEAETQLYNPAAQPSVPTYRTMTPTVEHSGFTLPPISTLYESASSMPRPRGYNLPEPTSQKRSYSPRSFSQDMSLKDGARPDAVSQASSTSTRQRSSNAYSWVMNGEQPHTQSSGSQSMEADNDPYAEHSDSEDSVLDGPFTYRRADGTRSNKPLVMPISY